MLENATLKKRVCHTVGKWSSVNSETIIKTKSATKLRLGYISWKGKQIYITK